MTPLVYSLALGTFVLRLRSGFYHAVVPVGTAQVDAAAFTLMAAQWLSGVVGALPNEVREIDDGDCATDVSTLHTNAAAAYDRCPRHTPTRSTDQRSQPCQV